MNASPKTKTHLLSHDHCQGSEERHECERRLESIFMKQLPQLVSCQNGDDCNENCKKPPAQYCKQHNYGNNDGGDDDSVAQGGINFHDQSWKGLQTSVRDDRRSRLP